jgi:hypothetical protein
MGHSEPTDLPVGDEIEATFESSINFNSCI